VEATNLNTMVQLVNAGIGCALLPEMAIESGILNGTSVELVPMLPPLPSREIALVTRASHPRLAFIEEGLCSLIRPAK
jgi:LysR family hydrogen peroxide-inducible transcriptional activator